MSTRADQRLRLRGTRCLCSGCGHLFGSPTAFDRHQRDDGSPEPCMTVAEFTARRGKRQEPRLVWHPTRHLWVTRLRDMDAEEDAA